MCVCSKNCADHDKAGTIQIQKYHSMGYSLPHPSHIPSGDSQESRGRKMRFSARSRRLCRRVRLSPDMVARGASSRLTAQRSAPAGRLGAEREYVNDHALGSAPINPPAAKPPFCVRRRCKANTLQYVHTASPNVCPLPAGKKRRFADGVFMRADPSAKAAPPPRRTPCTLRRWRPQPGGGAPTSR